MTSTKPQGRLEGKVVIITGAGQGIGRGMALAMAKEGAKLVITGRTPEKLDDVATIIRDLGSDVRCVVGLSGDRDAAERTVAEAIDAYGKLDVLINNAHTFTPGTKLEEMPEDWFATHFQTGFMGSVQFMQVAFPHMKANGGSIINLGSSSSYLCLPNHADYAGAKEAIRALTRTAAKEWGIYKIRVNMLNPAALSPYSVEYMKKNNIYDIEVARSPLGYIGDAVDDVAPVALFLASDDSHFVTGQTLMADGGRVMV